MKLLCIALLALSASLYAQTAAYTPQRTPEGLPDLEGLWQPQTNGAAYSILPHPPGFLLGAGSKVGIVEGGVLPYQPWAAEQVKYRLEHMETDPTGKCHYEGVPHAMYFAFQIFETPNADRSGAREHARLPHHPYAGPASSQGLSILDGRFARPLGRQHTGGGRHQQQR